MDQNTAKRLKEIMDQWSDFIKRGADLHQAHLRRGRKNMSEEEQRKMTALEGEREDIKSRLLSWLDEYFYEIQETVDKSI